MSRAGGRRPAHGLDDVGVGTRGRQRAEFCLRRIYNHMIEVYARHNGHAGLIREPAGGMAGR